MKPNHVASIVAVRAPAAANITSRDPSHRLGRPGLSTAASAATNRSPTPARPIRESPGSTATHAAANTIHAAVEPAKPVQLIGRFANRR